jgi:hypothetical protein
MRRQGMIRWVLISVGTPQIWLCQYCAGHAEVAA